MASDVHTRGVVLEGVNLHLTLAEIHTLMAQAYTALGDR
jgi:hypothetical protein